MRYALLLLLLVACDKPVTPDGLKESEGGQPTYELADEKVKK